MSGALEHFRYDLFLSYGWSGLQGADDGDRGWVGEFKRLLQDQISGELGRTARIHLDVEQSKNGALPENLQSAVGSSALFLSVLTHGACRPESWCRKELDWFVGEGAQILPSSGQLLSILLRDVEQKEWPEALQPIVPTEFLNSSAVRGPLPRMDLANASTAAGARLQDLGIQIARTLKSIDRQIARTVVIACSSPSRRPQMERLATDITKHDGNPILFARVDETEANFRARFTRVLNSASLLVCLMGDDEAAVPTGWSASLERVERDIAAARFKEDASSQVIVWRDHDSDRSSEWPNAQSLKSMGFEYLHSVLKQTFDQNVASASVRTAVPPTALPNGKVKYVFIDCVRRDLDRLTPLDDLLRARGYRVRFPLFEGNEEQRRAIDLAFLPQCEAVAVFYGSRDDLNAYLACQTLEASLIERQLSIKKEVLVDPYTDPVHKAFAFPDFMNYPFQPSEFVDRVTGS